MKKILTSLLILFLTISISSCSKKDEKNSAEISYVKATKLLKNKSYTEAAEAFIKIEEEFPFSKWAIRSQTMAIYCYYKADDHIKLLQTADDFLRLNPASEYVPYVLYMKGLSYFDKIPEITRAQDDTSQASFTFRELIARFPNTDYASDAREKLFFVDEHLAAAKMSVGRYQIQVKNFVGAINNFSEVATRYRNTNQVPEAYFRLIEIYYKLRMKKESLKAYKRLQDASYKANWLDLAKKIDPKLYE